MLEKMKPEDLAQVMEVWQESTIQGHPFVPQSYWEQNREKVEKEYLPQAQTWVWRQQGKVLGFASVMFGGYLGALFVRPEAQGQGIGSQLLSHCQEQFPALVLAVYCENKKAVAFYQRHGFVIFQEQEGQPKPHWEYVMEWKKA